jgi:hypothetical protein
MSTLDYTSQLLNSVIPSEIPVPSTNVTVPYDPFKPITQNSSAIPMVPNNSTMPVNNMVPNSSVYPMVPDNSMIPTNNMVPNSSAYPVNSSTYPVNNMVPNSSVNTGNNMVPNSSVNPANPANPVNTTLDTTKPAESKNMSKMILTLFIVFIIIVLLILFFTWIFGRQVNTTPDTPVPAGKSMYNYNDPRNSYNMPVNTRSMTPSSRNMYSSSSFPFMMPYGGRTFNTMLDKMTLFFRNPLNYRASLRNYRNANRRPVYTNKSIQPTQQNRNYNYNNQVSKRITPKIAPVPVQKPTINVTYVDDIHKLDTDILILSSELGRLREALAKQSLITTLAKSSGEIDVYREEKITESLANISNILLELVAKQEYMNKTKDELIKQAKSNLMQNELFQQYKDEIQKAKVNIVVLNEKIALIESQLSHSKKALNAITQTNTKIDKNGRKGLVEIINKDDILRNTYNKDDKYPIMTSLLNKDISGILKNVKAN